MYKHKLARAASTGFRGYAPVMASSRITSVSGVQGDEFTQYSPVGGRCQIELSLYGIYTRHSFTEASYKLCARRLETRKSLRRARRQRSPYFITSNCLGDAYPQIT
jgi:hypothetical protein